MTLRVPLVVLVAVFLVSKVLGCPPGEKPTGQTDEMKMEICAPASNGTEGKAGSSPLQSAGKDGIAGGASGAASAFDAVKNAVKITGNALDVNRSEGISHPENPHGMHNMAMDPGGKADESLALTGAKVGLAIAGGAGTILHEDDTARLQNIYAKNAGAKGVPSEVILPAMQDVVSRNTNNPTVAKEIVDHFAEKNAGAPLSPAGVGRWINLFNQDVKIDELWDKAKTPEGLTPAERQQWEALVKQRNIFMADTLGSDPAHHAYMTDDPIMKTLPADVRLDHDARIIDVNPASGYGLRGQTNLALGKPQEALADASKAISLDPKNSANYLTKGAAQERLGDFAGAYESAKKAYELDPKDKGAFALMKSVEGRSSGSGSSGASASQAQGGGPSGFASFGSMSGRGVAGMTSASDIASSQKLDEARRALKLGDFAAAMAYAKRALELNGNNPAAYAFMSRAYAAKGDYTNAIAMAKAGLALSPRDGELLNAKAFAENRKKLYRDALGSSTSAIEADSRNPESYANRGHAYGGLGDKDAMMSDIRRAASMDPRYQSSAEQAAAMQLPSKDDVMFLFPGEEAAGAASASAAPARARSFGAVAGAGILGGLLLAIGLLSTVLAPIKDSVVSAFTKATRVGPSVHALEVEDSPAQAEPPAPGLIRGQYQIARKIGEGGMGTVYEGTDRSLGRRVAIKKMRDELRVNPRERDRFIIEAKTVASLHHANIVDIYAIAEEGEDVYLVFEYVDGKTIHDLVQSQGRLAPADAVRLTAAMSSALSYAHSRGVIHRDMKPSNVMLSNKGEVKVMDFGIARMAKDALTRYSMTQNVVGTPPYMAPEQEQGVVRKESDVYSLAICSYEMLTGKLPFIGMGAGMLMNKINMSYIPPARAIAGLPDSLDEVFLKAFQADPEQRYRTPQEFSSALEAAFGGVSSPAKPV
jgi:tetratricopeptide (TPR) repeat protein